MFVLM
jgi:hypothetical protein